MALSNPLEAMCFASVLINSKKQPYDRYDKDNSADDKDGNEDISSACEEIKFLQVKAPLFNTPHNSGKIQKNEAQVNSESAWALSALIVTVYSVLLPD